MRKGGWHVCERAQAFTPNPNQSVSPFAVVLMIFVICFSPFLLAGFGLVERYTGFRLKMMRVDDKIRAAFEKSVR